MNEEDREAMGRDWASRAENLFDNLSPLEAMDKLKRLSELGGDTAINNDPNALQLVRSVANLKDEEINVWVNNWVPDRNAKKMLFFDREVRNYRNKSREALGMEPLEKLVN